MKSPPRVYPTENFRAPTNKSNGSSSHNQRMGASKYTQSKDGGTNKQN